ncbi:MAG: DUF3426 domain-containing protein [Castellaniella sp.]|uniref:zinc-ribbon and DUF3426 domain-containing protein n=1 Tax=Castellaniella sp. TaxID=1955812 RepID=UPI002A363585|nr:DUF3426 domain-containing protein [Castellaniella sp.]MDY0309369.1 DUF3426 domain-containing protein [Castellaniella sp.]
MDLTTRCPKCGTVFQAGLSDLQLRKGYIRCVQCAHIFDGYAEVVADAPGDPSASSRPSGAPGVAADGQPPQVMRSARPMVPAANPASTFHIGVAPWPDDRPEPRIGSVAGRTDVRPVDEILADEGWKPDSGGFQAQAGDRDAAPAQAEPFVVEARPGHRSQGGSAAPLLRDEEALGWWDALVRFCARLLLVLLVLLLAAQAAYVYRADIARLAPALRPALERACEPLRCQVPYLRDIGRIAITGSALKVADADVAADRLPGSPEPVVQHFVLHATLRNQAEQPQEWPTLILDLKDGAGTLLVRRNLSPAEYLGPARAAAPFAARSEVLVRVPLTLSGVRINGYQLDLFYP